LYGNFDEVLYQDKPQKTGKNAHKAMDEGNYSDKKDILMNYEVYTNEYGLFGKIDTFDIQKKILTERKNNIKTIYDGYVFQLYAHYFGLTEMGYEIREMYLYDYSRNKKYRILLPDEDEAMFNKFKHTIEEIKHFSLLRNTFNANINKCKTCIYNQLCDKSLC
jgi:CRISPR-associated protein Cas4